MLVGGGVRSADGPVDEGILVPVTTLAHRGVAVVSLVGALPEAGTPPDRGGARRAAMGVVAALVVHVLALLAPVLAPQHVVRAPAGAGSSRRRLRSRAEAQQTRT